MMNFIKSIYYYFSQYTDPEEHKVGKFFSNVNEKNNKTKVIREANIYLQRNIIIVNLWLERKYKGYNYLTKSKRKILYKNSELIKTDFEKYCNRYDLGTNLVLNSVNHRVNKISESNMQKLIYLTKIMTYLSPGNGLYNYRTSTTFGELLKDPKHSKITGDCNQIVTLYIYLFSLKYSINDLRLITIPGHVALRFCDLDIEATSGKFVDYSSKQPQELPIEEIIGINLLDTTDEYFQTHKIDSRFLLESARLAFILSSSGEIVATNLSIAYNNAIVDSVNKNNYTLALSYAKQYKNNQLLNYVSNKATDFYLRNNDFNKANNFALYSSSPKDLKTKIHTYHAAYLFNNLDYIGALKLYKQLNQEDMVKNCYLALFSDEQKKLGDIRTKEDAKNNKNVIQNMSKYAKLSKEKKLIEYVDSLHKFMN